MYIRKFFVQPTQYICVFCVDLKQRLFPYTALTDWFVCLLRGTDRVFKCNLGYMLYMDLRTNSDYFPIQH